MAEGNRLKKQLGLFDVFAVSSGAMFSSGFFLLPGLAAAKTGSSVVLAYLVAGLLMLPAMFSKAELSTAMPRAGGTYYFLDRSLGPMIGTIGGLGTWLVMTLKSSFALIGMGAYLSLVVDLPIKPVAVGLTLAFTLLNIVGVKQTKNLQSLLVITLLLILGVFLFDGVNAIAATTSMEMIRERIGVFALHGVDGFLATVGLVVVSYAGLTKVASVAEEVSDPERNIPLGMVLSLATATLVYVVGISLIVIAVPAEILHGDLRPVATAAGMISGWIPSGISRGIIVVAAIAGFAAAGNAALLSASRYPLALARDHLIPKQFGHLSPRFHTPVVGVLATAVLMIGCLTMLSVVSVAKLASSMQLLIFGLVNLAVIVMRESRLRSYDPGFRSPFYPWMQLIGIGASIGLIVVIGTLSALFTLSIVVVSVAWFHFYGRQRVVRDGAIYHVFSRLGKQRSMTLEAELRGHLQAKPLRESDPFDELVADAEVVLINGRHSFERIVERAAELFALRVGREASDLTQGFLEGSKLGMTPVSHGVALPHLRLSGLNRPWMVMVRLDQSMLPEGSEFAGDRGPAVRALFFLVSPADEGTMHLRILAEIASRVDSEDFLHEWQAAPSARDLRTILLRDERYLKLKVTDEDQDPRLFGLALNEVDLPEHCLVALVQRDEATEIPNGQMVFEEGDVLTIIGEPEAITELRERVESGPTESAA